MSTQLKTDLARRAKWEDFVKLCTICLFPGEKMKEEGEDFRSGWFGLGETYEAMRTTSTLSAPPRMPGMP